jgi:uncharacterized membrane protein
MTFIAMTRFIAFLSPFGIPATAFWIYVCASLLLIIGIIKIFGELPQQHGVDKIMPFGRLFFAIPLAVFGSEHLTITADIARIVPRWIPARTFWVYLVGVAFICAAVSIAILVQARLAAALVGMTFLIFVCLMDIPGVVARPGDRFFWALALRQIVFSGGAFAFAMSPWSNRSRRPSRARRTAVLAAIPRFFIGIPSLFYGVENLLHPAYVPGIPLQKLSPEWIPGRILLSYFVGVILILAGVCLLVNKKARIAATGLGLTILLTVLWIYLPMLIAAPTDVVALNFFFDTMLFCGTILLLANAMDKEGHVTSSSSRPGISTLEQSHAGSVKSRPRDHPAFSVSENNESLARQALRVDCRALLLHGPHRVANHDCGAAGVGVPVRNI